jgi:diguanylate cyclase (GGDEF)-like protein
MEVNNLNVRSRRIGGAPVVVAALLMAAHLLFLLLVQDRFIRLVVADLYVSLISLGASAAMFFAAWRSRRVSRRLTAVWLMFALAMLSVSLGDWLYSYYELVTDQAPFPSLADFAYLLYYPLFLLGILCLPVYRKATVEWLKIAVDMVIVMLVAAVGYWNFLLGPLVSAGGESSIEVFLTLAYPVGDLLLLWGVLVILYHLNTYRSNGPLWLLAAGLGVFIVTDSAYSHLSLLGIYQSGSWVDVGYTGGYLLLGLAAVLQARPAPVVLARVEPFSDRQLRVANTNGWTAYLPYGWVAAAYLMLVVSEVHTLPMNMAELIFFLGGVTALVAARQIVTISENRRLSFDLQFALEHVQNQAERLEQINHDLQAEILERRRVEKQLTYDTLHDALTGLPNRALFLDRLEQSARKRLRAADYCYAVLFLDLDSFKVVNDSLGHLTGDRLLVAAASVLRSCVRPTDTVARLGGDEFVILVDDCSGPAEVIEIADRLQAELSRPIELNGMQVYISVSIGIVINVDEYERPEDVLRDADLAMYQAKSQGKARCEIFHHEMRSIAVDRLNLETELRCALDNKELCLFYQPVLSLPEGNLVGFEALVRWKHPARGLMASGEFIPLAEENGLILPLGRWVLQEACAKARELQLLYPASPPLRISVNVSGKQLNQPDFIQVVTDVLADTQLPSRLLVLEVTESVFLTNLESTAETLRKLVALGVEIQIDDFGTGYSSLGYLHKLPVRSIKIDKLFIQSICTGQVQGPEMLRGIMTLVNDLGIKVVAEGIENETQLDTLNEMNCEFGQGFFLARPMDPERLATWLDTLFYKV